MYFLNKCYITKNYNTKKGLHSWNIRIVQAFGDNLASSYLKNGWWTGSVGITLEPVRALGPTDTESAF